MYPKLPEDKDKRVKIPKSEHPKIRELYKLPEMSMRKIAAIYGVDKRLIQFIIYPERIAAARANRDWRNYYTKEKWAQDMKKHRAHKIAVHGDEYRLFILGKKREWYEKAKS